MIRAFSSLTRIPASRLASLGAPFSHRSLIWVRIPFLRAIQRSRNNLQISVVANLGGFGLARSDAFACSLLQRCRRIVRQFGNGICHFEKMQPPVISEEAKNLCSPPGMQRSFAPESAQDDKLRK